MSHWKGAPHTILADADLTEANLGAVDLTYSSLKGADLQGARLKGANLAGVHYDRHTRWPKGFDPVKAGAVFIR